MICRYLLPFYALDITAGWPGTYLYYREIDYVYRVMPNVPASFHAMSAPTATAANDFTFVITPITPIAGDYIVLELDDAASLGSNSPVCEDGTGQVLVCTYYTDSNTVIMTMAKPSNSVKVFSIINPLPASTYLGFYINYWTLNKFQLRLFYTATKFLPIAVTYPSKTTMLVMICLITR